MATIETVISFDQGISYNIFNFLNLFLSFGKFVYDWDNVTIFNVEFYTTGYRKLLFQALYRLHCIWI